MNLQLKILHTGASCGWGGQEIRILEESKTMRNKGHEVILACPSYSKIYTAAQALGFKVYPISLDRKKIPTVFEMRRLLKQIRPDVINTHSSSDSWIVALARSGLTPNPAVVRTRHISAPVSKNSVTRWLYTKGADLVVTTGESLKATLVADLKLNPNYLTSIPTGIDPIRFSPKPSASDKLLAKQHIGLNPSTKIIGIVATLRSWKGHEDLINAWAGLAPFFADWRLLIVGDGPQSDNITNQVQKLGLTDTVICAGHQTKPEDYLAAIDIFCLPSYANEGVPQAILQAMFSGLAIVTTPVGAILEAVQHNNSALVVSPRDVTALKTALAQLMRSPEQCMALGLKAREQALEKFSLQSMADRMEQVFIRSLCPTSLQVIHVSRIGDTLLATPAIKAIADQWSTARLTLLGHPNRYEVLENFPGANDVGFIEKKRARFKNWLGKKVFDLSIVYGFDAALIQFALRSSKRVVALKQSDLAINEHLWKVVEPNDFHSEHATEHYLGVSRALGAEPTSKRLLLQSTDEEILWAKQVCNRFTGQPLIGLQMVSFPTKPYRDWPKEHFLEFCQRILQTHPDAYFVILGGPDDTASTTWLAAQLPTKTTLMAGKTSLRQTAALIGQLDLYVGVDTGPTHIAGSQSTPMIALYHSKHPSRQYGPRDHTVAVCIDHPNGVKGCKEDDSMEQISVDEVFNLSIELLAKTLRSSAKGER